MEVSCPILATDYAHKMDEAEGTKHIIQEEGVKFWHNLATKVSHT